MKQETPIDLPSGWVWANLGDVLPLQYGKGLPESERNTEGDFPVYGSSGQVGRHSRPLTQYPSLIVGRKGAIGAVYFSAGPCWPIDTTYFVEASSEAINLRYFLYLLKSINLEKLDKSTAVPSLSRDDYNAVTVPISPLAEQSRIVAEIEKQFTRLDAAVASLRRVQANLKRYRAAVLKAACEGRLVETEAALARAEQRPYEPAAELLQRILRERRARWEADQLANMEAAGKPPKDDKWKAKYDEPAAPDTNGLPELPEAWTWATLPQLGELNRGKSKHRPRNDPRLYGGIYPFIQTSDVKHSGGYIRRHTQTYNDTGLAQSRLWPAETLCITIAANIADTGILTYEACFPDSIVGFIAVSGLVSNRFIDLFFRTAREEIAHYAPATAQKNINLEILSEIAVPLPPLEEQKRIVAEVERQFSIIEGLERSVNTNLQRAESMRQKVLQDAFTGKLVEQDLQDESASDLLKRIKAERMRREAEEREKRKEERKTVKKTSKTATGERRKLVEVLREAERPLAPDALFREAGFKPEEVEAFYDELKQADKDDLITEDKRQNGEVYLSARA